MSAESIHNSKILIVDDEEDKVQLLREILRLDGYVNLHCTTESRDVARLITEFQPDLLLLDLMMDYLDGFQVMGQVASLIPTGDYFPILVISGDVAYETRHRALASGAKDFLSKPFDATETVLRVRNLLETRLLHRQVQQQNQNLEALIGERTMELTKANEALEHRIAEQERVETALYHSETKFRSLMESATDAILVVDHHNRITEWNHSAHAMFGYKSQEILGKPLSVLLPERHREVYEANFERFQSVSQVHIIGRPLELSGLHKNGIEFPVEVAVSAWEADGKRWYSGIIRDITERKRVEHELRNSEMLLAEAQHLARLGSWEMNLLSNTLVWSGELYRLHGIEPYDCEITFEKALERVHPVDREFSRQAIQKALKDHTPFDFCHRIIRPDNTVRILQVRGVVIVDEIAQPIRMLGSVQDVTEIKQAEESLQQSKEQLEVVLNAVPGAISWIDSDLRYLGVNSYLANVLNLSPEQVVGQKVGFLTSDPQFAEFVGQFFATAERSAEREVEIEVAGKTHTFWLMARKYQHNDAAVFIGTDITERKQAEQALQQTKDQLQVVLDTIPGGVSWVNSDLKYLSVNRFLAEKYHLSAEEFIGQDVGFLKTDQGYADFLHGFFNAEEQTASCEVPVCFDGAWRTILMTARRRNSGHSAVVIGIDITERKEAEAWLKKAHDELETRVQERTAKLHEAIETLRCEITERQQVEIALQASKEEAEAANRAKSDFLSRMSHELRTPLNAILGFAQLLQMDERPPQERQNLDYILTAGKHLLALIDEVLDIARIESGRVALSIEPVQISKVLEEMMELVRQHALQLQVELHNDADCDLWMLADSQRLKQVLLNLLSNAVKYNGAGGEVRVSCEKVVRTLFDAGQSAPQERLRIQVQDNGVGIPAAMHHRMFMPFERLGAEQGNIQGVGIGLALSKRLMEAMGGQMGFESALGKGSIFWIELPLVNASPIVEKVDDAQLQRPAASGTEHTILYIEDNLSNLHLIESILDLQQGIRLLAAMQGSIGLELARENPPDLILLDLNLPDMSGDEVLQKLRDDGATQGIPVVVLSADAMPGRIQHLLDAGADAYLTKPLQVRQFLQTVETMLQKNRRHDA